MRKPDDTVLQYGSLRKQLRDECAAIKVRLNAIDQALGQSSATTAQPLNGQGMTMRELIQQITAHQPMRIRDITAAMQASGYRFKTTKPSNSVGAYLSGKAGRKHFRKVGKAFAPV